MEVLWSYRFWLNAAVNIVIVDEFSYFLFVEENNRSKGPGQIDPCIVILVKMSKPIYMV
jgi:hypothetical protein